MAQVGVAAVVVDVMVVANVDMAGGYLAEVDCMEVARVATVAVVEKALAMAEAALARVHLAADQEALMEATAVAKAAWTVAAKVEAWQVEVVSNPPVVLEEEVAAALVDSQVVPVARVAEASTHRLAHTL